MHQESCIVIYHENCADGITAAWSFLYKKKPSCAIEFHPTNIRELEKDLKMPSLKDKSVFIVDYSYSRQDLEKIAKDANKVILYDHHETAIKNLGDVLTSVCDPRSILDMKRCGAEITWDSLHGSDTRPWFLKHVRDRDLWLWEDPDSKAFSAMFFQDGLNFETLDRYSQMDQKQISDLYARGHEILKMEQCTIQALCKTSIVCGMRMSPDQPETIHTLFVQSPVYQSEIGNQLLSMHDNIHVAAVCTYSVFHSIWKISLRSRAADHKDHVNVAEIAAHFKGGGHPSAAGFSFPQPLNQLFEI